MEIMLIILALFGAFYYMLLRPALKQQRAQRREMADLVIGDQVLTTGNIFATVADIETPEDGPIVVILEMGPGLRVRALPQSILQRVSPAALPERAGKRAPKKQPDTSGLNRSHCRVQPHRHLAGPAAPLSPGLHPSAERRRRPSWRL